MKITSMTKEKKMSPRRAVAVWIFLGIMGWLSFFGLFMAFKAVFS